jgi:transposase-like protein
MEAPTMTRHDHDPKTIATALELLTEHGFEGMAHCLEILFNEAMRIERAAHLGAGPYERSSGRLGYANGFKPKHVKTRVGELDLEIPQVRDLAPGVEPFYPSALERGDRSERALKLAVAEMYVQGVSTRRVTEITRELCGLDISTSQVSRAAQLLDEELEAWRTRPLAQIPFVVLDARYEKVRHGGSVRSVALLVAVGVDNEGHRTVLGLSVSLSEAEVHWRDFLRSLVERGLHGVRMVTSDDHPGISKALAAVLPGVSWQRCQCHLQRNAQAYVPRVEQRATVSRDIRDIFNASDRHEADRLLSIKAEKWRDAAPRLAEWMEENIPEGLTVFELPAPYRRRLRTSNMLERLNRELRRRTRVAGIFPNEASLLRLASALLVEQSEEWETGRKYLTLESDD